MIDIQQLTELISAFRVETEYNIIRFWKETKGCCFFVLPGHRWQSITIIIHFAALSGKYLYLTRRQ